MRYLYFALVLILLQGCTSEAPITTNFSAELKNFDGEEITIRGFDFNESIPVINEKAESELAITSTGLYELRAGRNRVSMHLTPGATITLTADVEFFDDTFKITGSQAQIQKYLGKKKLIENELFGPGMFKQEPESFLTMLDALKDSIGIALKNSNVPKDFAKEEMANIGYQTAQLKFIYPNYSKMDLENLPEAFKNSTAGIDLMNEEMYLKSSEYRELVGSTFSFGISGDTTDTYEAIFMKKIAEFPNGFMKNEILYGDMKYMMGPNENLNKFFEFFKNHSTNEKHLAAMTEQFESLQVLNKGNDSPDFDYENYKGGNTKLDDLKGKYVYIDVWATWCGPCKAEIPSLKKVEHQYEGKNIEFVSISVDRKEDYDKWRAMISDKELGGTQLMSDNSWQSKFVQDYQIQGIPRFILVDPEGKIVSADAPRPSNKKLVETLDGFAM